jgi:hypothetical protein
MVLYGGGYTHIQFCIDEIQSERVYQSELKQLMHAPKVAFPSVRD